jgi:hypothetical protein
MSLRFAAKRGGEQCASHRFGRCMFLGSQLAQNGAQGLIDFYCPFHILNC